MLDRYLVHNVFSLTEPGRNKLSLSLSLFLGVYFRNLFEQTHSRFNSFSGFEETRERESESVSTDMTERTSPVNDTPHTHQANKSLYNPPICSWTLYHILDPLHFLHIRNPRGKKHSFSNEKAQAINLILNRMHSPKRILEASLKHFKHGSQHLHHRKLLPCHVLAVVIEFAEMLLIDSTLQLRGCSSDW